MKTFLQSGAPAWLPIMLVIAVLCATVYPADAVWAEAEAEEHGEEHVGEGHAEEERIELTADQIKYAGISIELAGPAKLRETLPLYGQIVPNAEREHAVSARYPGLIRQVSKRVGDPVKQGEVLATVESNESLKPYSVAASLTGVLVQRQANIGEQTGERTLFVIGDYSTVWVNLSVFPGNRATIQKGQTVRVTSTDAATTAEGTIIAVSPVGSATNQSTTATVLLDNADGRWAPGQFVHAEVVLSEREVPVAVLDEAIQFVDDTRVVFVAEGKFFEVRPVDLGRGDGRFSEVLGGLQAGESYVAANSFVLKSELGKEGAEHGH